MMLTLHSAILQCQCWPQCCTEVWQWAHEPRVKQWVLCCLVRSVSLHRARPAAANSINILWHAKCVFYSCVYLIVLCFILDWYFLCPSISWWMEQIKCVLSLIHTKNKLSMTSYLKNESKKPRHRLPSVVCWLVPNRQQTPSCCVELSCVVTFHWMK